ncbi:SDR family NAD(P)-dependent oxidoreductase [Phytohabitans sp. ZYX-F-186]|uniref:SDR family NAD(P)-dependent oxidoreductase n=1 Tax=Phytohabitans maris TaxID=3071409 RepID=A0ABU0ZEQ2_9ACTN|nr:SDR family NAD(P)-dependent oxidoreductase [Phytohabitans sp. ZYX-F-186]MDQ7905534.1 SDR family NAD(P)-dependent oxidoreductase [Phytohabitans sp. ZYX-F-186]
MSFPPRRAGGVMAERRTFRDAVVVVTGASSGIGRATALAFAVEGASLVLASRGQEALSDVERDCRERVGQVRDQRPGFEPSAGGVVGGTHEERRVDRPR